MAEHYRKLGTPTTNKTFDVEFENARAKANVDASEGKTGVLQKGYRESSQAKK